MNGSTRLVPALLLAACALLTGCTGTSGADASGASDYKFGRGATGADGLFPVADRRPAPTLAGETLQGTPLTTASMTGDVIVLNFWADWCPPCRAESPFLNAVANKTAAAGVKFVGINVKDGRDAALSFERVSGTPYPSLYDYPGALLLPFRKIVPQTPPSTMLIDRQGRLLASSTAASPRANSPHQSWRSLPRARKPRPVPVGVPLTDVRGLRAISELRSRSTTDTDMSRHLLSGC